MKNFTYLNPDINYSDEYTYVLYRILNNKSEFIDVEKLKFYEDRFWPIDIFLKSIPSKYISYSIVPLKSHESKMDLNNINSIDNNIDNYFPFYEEREYEALYIYIEKIDKKELIKVLNKVIKISQQNKVFKTDKLLSSYFNPKIAYKKVNNPQELYEFEGNTKPVVRTDLWFITLINHIRTVVKFSHAGVNYLSYERQSDKFLNKIREIYLECGKEDLYINLSDSNNLNFSKLLIALEKERYFEIKKYNADTRVVMLKIKKRFYLYMRKGEPGVLKWGDLIWDKGNSVIEYARALKVEMANQSIKFLDALMERQGELCTYIELAKKTGKFDGKFSNHSYSIEISKVRDRLIDDLTHVGLTDRKELSQIIKNIKKHGYKLGKQPKYKGNQ